MVDNYKAPENQNLTKNKFDLIAHNLSKTEVAFDTGTFERLTARVTLWTKIKQLEWACVLVGSLDEVHGTKKMVVTDFVTLPIWSLHNRDNGLSININDIYDIAKFVTKEIGVIKRTSAIIGDLHTHPSGDLFPSAADWATFTYTDILLEPVLQRPLVHLIMGPDGTHKIYDFEICHNCPTSFLIPFREERDASKKRSPREHKNAPREGGV